MPVAISPYDNIPPWTRPAETKEALDWAPLKEIDLSLFDAPGGKEKLAAELHDAVKNGSYSSNAIFLPSGVISLTVGFWVVTGHGIPDGEVLRQFSIGNAFFNLPVEEKQKHPCNFAVGEYFGYREPKPIGSTGVKENHEMLNIPKYTANEDYNGVPKHDIVLAHEAEIAAFQRKLFDKVARKLFILLAIILELPENYLLDRHAYDQRSEDHLRYMVYHPRTVEERKLVRDGEGGGHTDYGSLTLLFSQNVAGLQIRTPHGDWKFVKPVEGGITVNRFVIASSARSQIKLTSTVWDSSLYFVRPGDDTPIIPVPSPVLERAGLLTSADKEADPKTVGNNFPTMKDWTRARVENAHNRISSTVAFEDQTEKTFKFKGLEVVDRWQ
ncbi:putative Flavonol synthase [Mycena sanguinolenta]|uniref:Putative Flavonol synthase n=1 Tax=Mycena sanguinolenta TaxID=230812 RepID=A0A8H7CXD6_9AGAR|nr:putative Flavonol synthase [Mycena sanguinolenta]